MKDLLSRGLITQASLRQASRGRLGILMLVMDVLPVVLGVLPDVLSVLPDVLGVLPSMLDVFPFVWGT